jgi:hypothetical protein
MYTSHYTLFCSEIDRSPSALVPSTEEYDHLQEVPEKLAERVIHSNGNGGNGNGK